MSERQQHLGYKLWIGLSILVAVIYISAGIYLLVNIHRIKMLPYFWQLILGVLLIAYGIFRGYRSATRYKTMMEESDNES